jgi:hypothetical protein
MTATPTLTSTPDLSGPGELYEVPTLSDLGLAVLALLLLGIGTALMVRKRG